MYPRKSAHDVWAAYGDSPLCLDEMRVLLYSGLPHDVARAILRMRFRLDLSSSPVCYGWAQRIRQACARVFNPCNEPDAGALVTLAPQPSIKLRTKVSVRVHACQRTQWSFSPSAVEYQMSVVFGGPFESDVTRVRDRLYNALSESTLLDEFIIEERNPVKTMNCCCEVDASLWFA